MLRSRLLVSALFALLCVPLLTLEAAPGALEGLALRRALEELDLPGTLAAARAAGAQPEAPGRALDPAGTAGRLRLRFEGETARHRTEIGDALRGALTVPEVVWEEDAVLAPLPGLEGEGVVELRVEHDPDEARLRLFDAGGGLLHEERTGGRSSLVPPLLAILLAFLTRSVIPSLLLGVLAGGYLLVPRGHAFVEMFPIVLRDIVWAEILSDPFHLYILGFVLGLSATVAVVTRMGGIDGMVQALLRFARSRRSVQAVAYFLGLGIFFDDYANTIIVGNSAGPLFDRMKVSRAKLAYIVDSTAAPVAGIAVLSTWVAYQISTYAPQLPTIGLSEQEGYTLFLETIPYRFYCLFAIALVGFVILMQRDLQPMAELEERALRRRSRSSEEGPEEGSEELEARVFRAPWAEPRWWNGVLPLFGVMVGFTALLIYSSGASAARAAIAEGNLHAREAAAAGGLAWLREVLSFANSTWAIFYGSLAALASAALLALGQRLLKAGDLARTAVKGVASLFQDAVLILVLAWSIAQVCENLRTANYLVAVTQSLLEPALLPTILFLTSCFVAFSTGSSWATMAIMQPNVVLLAHRLGEGTEFGSHGLLILSLGAVLEGAIFGDHCSPISDTTVLSSIASRCHHIDHVRTQAPYALLAATVALLTGYLPVAFVGVHPFLGLGTGLLVLAGALRLFGRPAPGEATLAETA